MSVNWSWNNKCGEIFFEQKHQKDGSDEWETKEYSVQLYEGNAFMIMLYEWEENGKGMYNMYSFFIDEDHAKRCLGLKKNGDGELCNMFEGGLDTFTKIRINKAKSRHWKKIVSIFAQAFSNITIEIFTDDSESEDE